MNFSSENINITIMLMQGNHTLKNCGINIEHLETCIITGVGSASESVTVYTFRDIWFDDTITIYIENLTLIGGELLHNTRPALMFATSIDYSQNKRPNNPYYRLMFININRTEIRGIFIHTNQYLTNFVIVLAIKLSDHK